MVVRTARTPHTHRKGPSPAVAGVIGAVVTAAVAGIVALLAFFLLGCRVRRERAHPMGGFKGGEKLASDADLTKGGTAGKGHERVGSWELGDAAEAEEAAGGGIFGGMSGALDHKAVEGRRSIGEEGPDDLGVNPFGEGAGVKPHERV